jgi:N-acyl homoserine lactone hydrolase
VTKREGDLDMFGRGSVNILSTPGHTPAHLSLLAKMPKTGAVVSRVTRRNRRVPELNVDKDRTLASM